MTKSNSFCCQNLGSFQRSIKVVLSMLSEETFVRFTSRLHNLLTYYLRSRDVTTFDALCQIIVSDKLKLSLSANVLNNILSLEGDDWFDPGKIASLADTYVANHDIRLSNPRPSVPRAASPRKGPPANLAPQQSWRSYPGQSVVPFRPRFDRGRGTGHSEQSYRPRKECFCLLYTSPSPRDS